MKTDKNSHGRDSATFLQKKYGSRQVLSVNSLINDEYFLTIFIKSYGEALGIKEAR